MANVETVLAMSFLATVQVVGALVSEYLVTPWNLFQKVIYHIASKTHNDRFKKLYSDIFHIHTLDHHDTLIFRCVTNVKEVETKTWNTTATKLQKLYVRISKVRCVILHSTEFSFSNVYEENESSCEKCDKHASLRMTQTASEGNKFVNLVACNVQW